MQLVVISPEAHYKNEQHWLQCMFEAGLSHFHLRKPGWSLLETRDYLKQIHPKYYHRIVLHDHYALQDSFTLKGKHANCRNAADRRGSTRYAPCGSASFHTYEEVINEGGDFDYVFLSPIFDSISKVGYRAAFDTLELRSFLQENRGTEVYALGGVEASNISECKKMGFHGVAVLGGIWNHEDPFSAFSIIQKQCQENEPAY